MADPRFQIKDYRESQVIHGDLTVLGSLTGAVGDVQNNYEGTSPPTVNNDITEGYVVGSAWVDNVGAEAYRCLDATEAAAVWIKTTLSSDELGSMAFQNANAVSITGGTVNGITVLRMLNAAGPELLDEAATSTNPTVIPNRSDPNTGIGWNAADVLSLIAGGSEIISLSTTGVNVNKPIEMPATVIATGYKGITTTIDAAGFADAQATEVDIITGALPAFTTLAVHRVSINKVDADANSFVAGYSMSSTNGASVAYHSVSNINVRPIGQIAGAELALTTGLVDGVDELADLNNDGVNTNIFVADDDTITVGHTNTFSQIEFILDTVASGGGISPTFEYSTGVGTWSTLVVSSDATNGMRNTGIIGWVTGAVAGWATGTGGDYLIRITRTRNTLATTPIAKQLLLETVVFYEWDDAGNLDVNGIQAAGNINITGNVISADAAGPSIVNEAATTTNPTLIPNRAELDTGIGWASDTVHLIGGGVSLVSASAAATTINVGDLVVAAGFVNVANDIELTIATGVITVTQSNHIVDTQSDASTDDVDTINGGEEGNIIFLSAAHADRDVVFKTGTGNLNITADITLTDINDNVGLIFKNAAWTRLMPTPAGGGGDVSKVGTPVNNQIGVWTGDGTIEGDSLFTWNSTTLAINTAVTTGITHNISLIPSAALGLSAVWHGLHIDGSSLTPASTGAEITGIEIDFSGVTLTNDPVMHGIEIAMPVRKDAIHIHEGQIVSNNTPDATATSEFHALDIRVDTTLLATTSAWSAMAITAVGSSSGEVDAILVRNQVGPIRQEVGSFVTPSQTEYAGRKTGGGSSWVDGIDGNEIFIVDNDEIYIGAVAQFSQIEVIMTTGATKDCVPTFWYNTAADTWTQFFPDDETSGFQTSSLISWVPDSISALWTNDGDPGVGDSSTGYWIKIIRTRNADPGSPTPATMKTGTVVTYSWDKAGDLVVKSVVGNKSATETQGGLIERSTSAENVTGTATEVTPDVAGVKEMIDTHGGGGGSLVFIAAASASSDATIEFTGIDSTYDEYIVRMLNVIPATHTALMYARTSTDGGSSYDSSAGNYSWLGSGVDTILRVGSSTSDTQISLSSSTGIGGNSNMLGISGDLRIIRPSEATYTELEFIGSWATGVVDNFFNGQTRGHRKSAADVDAIQILASSGNIASGLFALYGVKRAA